MDKCVFRFIFLILLFIIVWVENIYHQIFEAEVQPLCVTNNVGHRPSYATLIYILWKVLHPGKTIGNV